MHQPTERRSLLQVTLLSAETHASIYFSFSLETKECDAPERSRAQNGIDGGLTARAYHG